MANAPQIRTGDFEALYERVTRKLENHINDEQRADNLLADKALWFHGLIQGFQREFNEWRNYRNNDLEGYLQIFEAPGIDPNLRLAAHAFLHIAYDLPRVIANSLVPPHSRSDLRTIFLRPTPLFLKTFLVHAKSGHFGLLGRILGYFESARVLAFWVIALRSVAWIHAEILADAGPVDKLHLEERMAQALLAAGREATIHRWIRIRGVPDLENTGFMA